MKRLWQYFEGYRFQSVLGPLFKLTEAIMELFVPIFVARIIDEAIPTGDIMQVLPNIAWMFGIALAGLLFAITAQYFAARAAVGFTRNLSVDLFEKVTKLGRGTRDTLSDASLLTRLTSDTFQVQSGLNTFFRLFMRSPFIVFGSLIMAMQIDLSMTGIFLEMIILLMAIVMGLIYIANPVIAKIRTAFDRLTVLTREQMQGLRVIRAFRQESREVGAFGEQNADLTEQQVKVGDINAWMNPLTYVTVNVALILVIWRGGWNIQVGSLTQGELLALVNYLLSILTELVKLATTIMNMNRSWASAKRLVGILALPDETLSFVNEPNTFDTPDIAFAFEDVTFQYPDAEAPSLEEIAFAVKQGSFFGIIGSTGSGKSTLLKLVTKSFDPSEGHVHFNDQYMDTTSRLALREDISVVPGQVSLFKGTIRSNLAMGKMDATDAEMWQALADAQAKDFVEALPEGLDAPVAAFGRNFSGGQRQRLTIARALIKPAKLLIFDDSTSALDYVTEANFQQVLHEKYPEKTILMISQRTHSLKRADQILVLEAGRQVGLGTHAELLADNQVYQEIYASQHVEEGKQDEAVEHAQPAHS
ncbi:multidrug ABC transporter ATP-binding protein [Suicoccus acidiformans]|uniref:Multidrug ABC transporter ATP-binding protein n=1 Tax=Suicoccus acidiformans TaxID=2036206 RepID=A0A347WID6_9LACT|nr:ABC transporter ATP-binding protein [Suicoccus acidiformans]AXY24843.1 multidrug ABC transporter ATP-binding protein [Suicoccus acidiformans]